MGQSDSTYDCARRSAIAIADTQRGLDRAVMSIESADLRVTAAVTVPDAAALLESQAGADIVLLNLSEEDGAPLAQVLDAIGQDVENGRYRCAISLPFDMIDSLIGRIWHPDIFLAVDSNEEEFNSVLRAAAAFPEAGLHDSKRHPTLFGLSRDVGAFAEAAGAMAHSPPDLGRRATTGLSAQNVRSIICGRRLRSQFFEPGLFADPAFDILLDLMAARLEHRQVSVSSLCIAAGVPATTALRWINVLEKAGMLQRTADARDKRRMFVELTDSAADRFYAYISATRSKSLDIL